MSDNFRSIRGDFRGGVKSQTHRRQGGFHTFPRFPGCSLEGYAWAHAHTHDLPLEKPPEIAEMWEIGLPSCGGNFPPTGIRCEIGCEIGGDANE